MGKNLVADLLNAGVEMIVQLESGSGPKYFTFSTPEETVRFIRDPEVFAARFFKCISVEEYREWIKHEGQPLCGATNKNGELCHNQAGSSGMRLSEWRVSHRVALCRVHSR